jgi:hypothetical protein
MANMKDTHRMRIYPPTPEHVAITKSVQEVEDMFTQDIRETLYADDGIVSVVEKLNESLPTLPTVIDLKDAKENYVIEDGKNSIVVLTDNNAENANRIILPAAIVGLRVTIINQDDASVIIEPARGEHINGSDSTPFELTTLNSATFYCYADGYWAII